MSGLSLLAASLAINGCAACGESVTSDTPSVTADRTNVEVGESVTFTGSFPCWGFAQTWWDPDGDRSFENPVVSGTGTSDRATQCQGTKTHSYASPGRYTARMYERGRVNGGLLSKDEVHEGEATIEIVVSESANAPVGAPPVPTFTVTPNPVRPSTFGGVAKLDASQSVDPDGTIVRYQWDLDFTPGNFELDSGASPFASFANEHTGQYSVSLKVTDNAGNSAVTTRTIVVSQNAQASAAASLDDTQAMLAAGGAVFRFRPTLPRELGDPQGYLLNDQGEFVTAGQPVKGDLPLKLLPKKLRGKARTGEWVGSVDIASSVNGDTTWDGTGLLKLPGGGLACLGFSAETPASGLGQGSVEVLGGRGAGARLYGTLAGTASVKGRSVVVRGRNHLLLAEPREGGLQTTACAPLRALMSKAF